jgi:hypothetical protein
MLLQMLVSTLFNQYCIYLISSTMRIRVRYVASDDWMRVGSVRDGSSDD